MSCAFLLQRLCSRYDEITGEKAYKPVVQLFKNETKQWCTVCVDVDGREERIISTPGHKYYLPYNTENREIGLKQEHESYAVLSEKWVSACKLKVGDKVLLSDGRCGIIKAVEVEELESAETTYNLEVEDFHTYYVSDSNVLVHNMCKEAETVAEKLGYSKVKGQQSHGQAVFTNTIDYKEAKSYRKERDGMLRQNQWHDLTVRVFM